MAKTRATEGRSKKAPATAGEIREWKAKNREHARALQDLEHALQRLKEIDNYGTLSERIKVNFAHVAVLSAVRRLRRRTIAGFFGPPPGKTKKLPPIRAEEEANGERPTKKPT